MGDDDLRDDDLRLEQRGEPPEPDCCLYCGAGAHLEGCPAWAREEAMIAAAPDLVRALERIANHQVGADHCGMVEVEEVRALQGIARGALMELEQAARELE